MSKVDDIQKETNSYFAESMALARYARELEEEIARLRAELRWYADASWQDREADHGDRAEKALEAK